MISRRLLRIKILQTVYAYRKNGDSNFVNHFKEYEFSIKKSYDLYLYILLLLLELKHYSYLRIDQIKNRVIKDDQEWKRLVRFTNNRVFTQLENNSQFQSLIKNEKISWGNQKGIIKEIYTTIINSELYEEYLLTIDSYEADKKFIKKILLNVILETENLYNFLEETSIFWNDDVDQIGSMVEKTIKQFKENEKGGGALQPMFKDADAQNFSKTLFTQTIEKWSEYNVYVDANLKNWEQDRVAELDVILLQMAVTEAIIFPEIPIRVTLNEYIELAKWYSTEKSSVFINGILHAIFETLQKEKKIVKKGRGLIL